VTVAGQRGQATVELLAGLPALLLAALVALQLLATGYSLTIADGPRRRARLRSPPGAPPSRRPARRCPAGRGPGQRQHRGRPRHRAAEPALTAG
jgi:hypothetical protein